MLKFQPTLY